MFGSRIEVKSYFCFYMILKIFFHYCLSFSGFKSSKHTIAQSAFTTDDTKTFTEKGTQLYSLQFCITLIFILADVR